MTSKLPRRRFATLYRGDLVVLSENGEKRTVRFDDLSTEELELLFNPETAMVVDQPLPKTLPPRAVKKPSPLSRLLRPAGPRTVETATYLLDIVSALVPKRISNEEIGDALEIICSMQKAGRPKWLVYLKVVTTFWWVILHTLLHYAERMAGILSLSAGKSDDKK
jgi:hypothetical protein